MTIDGGGHCGYISYTAEIARFKQPLQMIFRERGRSAFGDKRLEDLSLGRRTNNSC